MNISLSNLACSCIVLSSLAACGGGSGGSGATENGQINAGIGGSWTAPTVYPVKAAATDFFAKQATYTIESTQNNVNYKLVSSFTPRSDEIKPTLSASPLKSYLFTESMSVDGTQGKEESSIIYYSSDSFEIWGESVQDASGQFSEPVPAESRTPLPTFAVIGQSGHLGKWHHYDENSNAIKVVQTMTWELEAASADNAWLCFETQLEEAEKVVTANRCLEITAQGNVTGYRAEFRGSGSAK